MGLGGSSEFACPLTGGVTCENVSSVYRMSRSGTLPSKTQPPASSAPSSSSTATTVALRGTGRDGAGATGPGRDRGSDRDLHAQQDVGGSPMPSIAAADPAWVIVPYEDADGDLVGDAYVFIPVDSGRWMVEHARQRIRDAYAPRATRRSGGGGAQPRVQASSTTTSTASSGAGLSFPAPDGGADLATFTSRDEGGGDATGAAGGSGK